MSDVWEPGGSEAQREIRGLYSHIDDTWADPHPQYQLRRRLISTGAPTNPSRGDIWVNSDDGGLYVYNPTRGWVPPWNLPWGIVGYDTLTSPTASIGTTPADTGLEVAFTAVRNRWYKATVHFGTMVSASVQDEEYNILLSDGSNNTLGNARCTTSLVGKNQGAPSLTHIVNYVTNGAQTLKVRAYSVSGTFQLYAASTIPAWLVIEDIGPVFTDWDDTGGG